MFEDFDFSLVGRMQQKPSFRTNDGATVQKVQTIDATDFDNLLLALYAAKNNQDSSIVSIVVSGAGYRLRHPPIRRIF
jgi:hypothetical protein